MNIFVTDKCPNKSAQWLEDNGHYKRINKMILENVQMLSTAIYVNILKDKYPTLKTKEEKNKYREETGLYLPTHINHPCNVWLRESKQNINWLIENTLTYYQCKLDRTGKGHKSIEVLKVVDKYRKSFENKGLTHFVNCARNISKGVDFTHIKNVHNAYKLYLTERKKNETN